MSGHWTPRAPGSFGPRRRDASSVVAYIRNGRRRPGGPGARRIFGVKLRLAAFLLAFTALHSAAAPEPLPAPVMIARVVPWAEDLARKALSAGRPLDAAEACAAREVGVRHPAAVRILVVDAIPLPEGLALQAAAKRTGISADRAGAMTLGHAILVVRGEEGEASLLRHELRHVAQYEEAGGIGPFLARHLPELMSHGYEGSPFEVDARAHEARIGACRPVPGS
jgi:hypothetical protein